MDLQELEKRYHTTLTANQEAELDWQKAISHLEFQEFIDAAKRYRAVTGRQHPQTRFEQLRGFVAFLLHPTNSYLQPICTLVLALAVMSVDASTTREAENREMCARYMAFIGRDRDDPQRQAALKKMADRLEVPSIRGNDVYAFCATYR